MQINSILVTGGTGTFGKAFITHLLKHTSTERIVCYSRGEHAQANLCAELGNDERVRWMIGDVRDLSRLQRAMHGVDVVVHAAALKRIETGQYNPDEMVKTNVFGAVNIIEAAVGSPSVRKVVGLSTDKAYQPISPYGQSKALAEGLLLAANTTHAKGPAFSAIRYGNVWMSQGSVVPKWIELKERGEPIYVTDPDCTRYCMSIGEAVRLVWGELQTRNRDLVIPSWLPAYRLGDLAEAMGIEPIVTGLPFWEKKHESMSPLLCSADAKRLTIDDLKEWLEI